MFCFDRCPFDDEGESTKTSFEQLKTEDIVVRTYEVWKKKYTYQQQQTHDPTAFHPSQPKPDLRTLYRGEHFQWLLKSLKTPPNRASFATIHPWLVYWIIQSLALLDISPILSPQERQIEEEKRLEAERLAAANMNDSDDSDAVNGDGKTEVITIKKPTTPKTIWTREFGLDMIAFLTRFQHPDGGFAGHFGGDAHIITSYASIMSMVIIGTRCGVYEEAYQAINIPNLIKFMMKLKITDPTDENYGAFHTCIDGEADTRSVFAAMVVSDILGLFPNEELTAGTAQWLSRCQNYDGGFSCEPGVESHGGYTLTALASLVALESCHLINLDHLEKWCVTKQMEREGGFCGRTHKLVDSCYSFWVGSSIALIHTARQQIVDRVNGATIPTLNFVKDVNSLVIIEAPATPTISTSTSEDTKSSSPSTSSHCCHDSTILPPHQLGWLYDQQALQTYLCFICQDLGFKDKPGMPSDYYHTCYSLSGLATAQVSVPFQKASYNFINQDKVGILSQNEFIGVPSIQSPSASVQSPALKAMYNEVNGLNKKDDNNTSISSNDDIILTPSPPSNNSSFAVNQEEQEEKEPQQAPVCTLPEQTLDLIKQNTTPTVLRVGGTQAKLHFNNIIYNIPQACYTIAHQYQQSLKQKAQQ